MDMVDARIDLRRALPCLTEKQAEALGMWYEGYTQREIGERLGVSREAIRDRIDRALERLRDMLA